MAFVERGTQEAIRSLIARAQKAENENKELRESLIRAQTAERENEDLKRQNGMKCLHVHCLINTTLDLIEQRQAIGINTFASRYNCACRAELEVRNQFLEEESMLFTKQRQAK